MIPVPIINGNGYLFNLEHVKELREKYNIIGVLVGILPQFPQQNVFMGLPIQLTPEETKFLLDEKIGFLLDDTEYHEQLLSEPSKIQDPKQVQMQTDRPQDMSGRSEWLLEAHPVQYREPHLVTYQLFRYLNKNNLFCMPGLRFGCHFLAYPGDPLRYHAHFNTRGLEWDEKFNVLDIVGCGRLGTAVKKCWVVGAEDDQGEYRAFSIEWAAFG